MLALKEFVVCVLELTSMQSDLSFLMLLSILEFPGGNQYHPM